MAVAIKDILYNNRQYHPGDVLPDDGPVEAWIDAGTAVDNTEPVKKTRTKRAVATPGLDGTATPPSEEDLVGKVPKRK